MSVFVILRLKGDPDTFERYANEHADVLVRIGDAGRSFGATRHAFAGGEGQILVIDEWPDEASFQRFFDSQTDIPQVLAESGVEGPPQITLYRKLNTPDEF